MAVKVIITRHFSPDRIGEAYRLLMELRALATVQNGYVSGETLFSAEIPNKVVVVSTWVSRKRWEDWQADTRRKEFSKKLDAVLKSPEEVEVFLVGEKLPEWVDMA